MDFYSDKGLFKIAFIALLVSSIPILLLGYTNAGIKGVIFAAWILFVVVAFFIVVAITLHKGTETTSEGFLGSYIDIWFNFHGYKIFLFLLFAGLVVFSSFLWDWLEQFFPLSDAAKSQMPIAK